MGALPPAPDFGAWGTPALAPPVRSIRVHTIVIGVLLAVWCVLTLVTVVDGFRLLDIVERFAKNPEESGLPGLVSAGEAYDSVARLQAYALIAAGIAFVVWCFRARANAELLSGLRHRRARGWLIFGWLVPIVALWFPYQIMNDLWRASDPRTRAFHDRSPRCRGAALLGWWWAGYLVFVYVNQATSRLVGNPDTLGVFRSGLLGLMVSDLVGLVAAALVFLIVRRIWMFQTIVNVPAVQA